MQIAVSWWYDFCQGHVPRAIGLLPIEIFRFKCSRLTMALFYWARIGIEGFLMLGFNTRQRIPLALMCFQRGLIGFSAGVDANVLAHFDQTCMDGGDFNNWDREF